MIKTMAKPKFNKHDLVYVSADENLFKDGRVYFNKGFYGIPREVMYSNGIFNYMLMMLNDDFSYETVCGWYSEYQLKLVRHNVNIGIKDAETNKLITLDDINKKIKVYKDESGHNPKYIIEKYDNYGHHTLLSDLSKDNITLIRSQINQLLDNG